MPDVSIVIVVHRESLDVLRACFDAVFAVQGVTCEVFIVDNGANDAYRDEASRIGAVYIRNGENKGFAYAVNRGIERSSGRFVLLLNPAFGGQHCIWNPDSSMKPLFSTFFTTLRNRRGFLYWPIVHS